MDSVLRVLVVDDSVVVRRILRSVLEEDGNIEVQVASNGNIALAKLKQGKPDLVTLDVDMPGMDGLEVLKKIREQDPYLPVIMFSTLTERCAKTTLDALARGANDYVTKPANVGHVSEAMQRIRDQLIPKIRTFCAEPEPIHPIPAPKPRATATDDASELSGSAEVVCIGVSTGGPAALESLLTQLPADYPAPVLIVQHMPPMFTAMLAERLNRLSPLEVREAQPGDRLEPGCVLLAPGDYHLLVTKAPSGFAVTTNQEPLENSCRPAVDVLFRSVAKHFRGRALGVVLTGMGSDGYRGAQAIHEAGGLLLAQDQASSVVWGMPRFVAEAGLAEEVLPLVDLGAAIVDRTAPALRAGA